jgi:uncharacterized membrane protein YbhN (UPF0104 family)
MSNDPPPEALGAPAPGSSGASRLRRVVRVAFLVVAAGFCAVFFTSRWDEVRAGLDVLTPVALVVCALAGASAIMFSLLGWRALLMDAGSPVALRPAARIFLVSQLGKYIPGSVWTVVAQVELGREYHVPARRSAAVSLLALSVSTLAGLVTASLALPFSSMALARAYWWVFLAAPLLIFLLHPRAVAAWSGLAFRLLRREPEPLLLSWRGLGAAAAWAMLTWVALGIHFGVLVRSVAGSRPEIWWLSLGVFALAWVAGFLFVVVPAGAGVREAVLVLGLSSVVSPGGALVLALVSRVVLVVVDVVLAGMALAVGRRRTSVTDQRATG